MKHIHSLIAFVMLAITTISFASCSSEDETTPKFSNVTLHAGEKKIMKEAKSFTWESSNKLIAAISNDTLYGRFVGTATLTSKGGSFDVKVEPVSHLYKDPYLKFGASPSTVKTWMKANVSTATLKKESPELLTYECSRGAALFYGYSIKAKFGYKQGTLSSVLVGVKTGYADELADFLIERYLPVEVNDQYIMMASPELDMVVMLQPDFIGNTPILLVYYAPYQSKNRSAINSDLFKSLLKPTSKTPESEAAFKNLVNSIKAAQ